MSYKYVLLQDICEKASSNIAQKELIENEGTYPIYGASGFIKNVDFFQQEKEYIAIVKDGAGIGRAMKLPAKSSVIGTMQYIIPKDNINISYLYYAICSMHLEKYFSGATIPHIYFRDYKNEKLPLPPLEVQLKIAAIFENLEHLIENKNKQLISLDKLAKSRFIEMFGDPLSNTAKWSFQKVGDVVEAIDPQPSHRTPAKVVDGIPYISIKDCDYRSGYINFKNARKVSKDILKEHIRRYNIKKGDFIIGKIGTIGKPLFIPTERNYTLSANVILLKPKEGVICPCFLKSSFETPFVENQFYKLGNSTSQAAFGIQKVRDMSILNPNIDVQMQYEKFYHQVNKSKLAIQQSLEKLEILKKSLMQEYFG